MATEARLAGELEKIVLRKIADDSLVLPSLPTVALRAMKLLQHPDNALKQLATTLGSDPVLSAQVIRLASAAAYGGQAVKTIEAAVTRLGAQRIRSIVVEACTRKLFESRDPTIAEASRKLWEHSVAVALLARDLVALTGGPEAETAYLTGLLHDVGKPVLAGLLLEAERMLAAQRPGAIWIAPPEWVETIQRRHRAVGAALAEKWGLPDVVREGIRDNGDYDSVQRQSIANYVRFANAVAKRQGLYVGDFDPQDVDALCMVGRTLLGIDDEVLDRLCSDLANRVRSHTE